MTRLVVQLLVSALLIVGVGTVLARAADVIAARTRLGRVWVGSVFLAAATSLPEIFTDVSAVRMGAADLAVGDLFGSSMANMVILALVTLAPAGQDLFRKATLDHALYAALALLLTAIAALGVLTRSPANVGGIGYVSLVLLVSYVAGSRVMYKHSIVARVATETVEMSGSPGDILPSAEQSREGSIARSVLTFVGGAVVLVFAAPLFADSAAGLARLTGLGETFVGTWLVGFSTSLPELVTSLAAVRMRAYDLAVGNLFGSNAFNMAILPVLDAANGGQPVLAAAHQAHALSGLVAIGLMGLALAALVYRARGRFSLLEPSSAAILAGYVVGLALVLTHSVP